MNHFHIATLVGILAVLLTLDVLFGTPSVIRRAVTLIRHRAAASRAGARTERPQESDRDTEPPPPPASRRIYSATEHLRVGPALMTLADRLERAPTEATEGPRAVRKRVLVLAFDDDLASKAAARAVGHAILALADDLG